MARTKQTARKKTGGGKTIVHQAQGGKGGSKGQPPPAASLQAHATGRTKKNRFRPGVGMLARID